MVAAAGQRVAEILLTHGHPDHAEGAASFAAMTGAPVLAADPAHRLGGEGLSPGDTVTAGGCEVRVVATPGRSPDSVCLLLPADEALLTGDTVLGRGTTVIAAMAAWPTTSPRSNGCGRSPTRPGCGCCSRGHGPLLADPAGTLDYYLAHRRERLAEVAAALAAGTAACPTSWPACTPTWTVRSGRSPNGRSAHSWTIWPPPRASRRASATDCRRHVAADGPLVRRY